MNRDQSSTDAEERYLGPLVLRASNVRFVEDFPKETVQLWSADITSNRTGGDECVFKSILFVETSTTASVFGSENEDGRPLYLRADLAEKQQEFVAFLRVQTVFDNDTLGPMRRIFTGHEYSSELKVIKAYLRARGSDLDIGVGFWDEKGEYILLAVEAQNS